jgi:hypothetical protein
MFCGNFALMVGTYAHHNLQLNQDLLQMYMKPMWVENFWSQNIIQWIDAGISRPILVLKAL